MKSFVKKFSLKEFWLMTIGIEIMVIGIYFFKFPYKFAFGGVTGYATMIGALTNLTATRFSNIANISVPPLLAPILNKIPVATLGIETASTISKNG